MSPRCPLRFISKNAVSYFIREVISRAMSLEANPGPSVPVRAHSVRGVASSVVSVKNAPLEKILEAACWKSASVFSLFLFKGY